MKGTMTHDMKADFTMVDFAPIMMVAPFSLPCLMALPITLMQCMQRVHSSAFTESSWVSLS